MKTYKIYIIVLKNIELKHIKSYGYYKYAFGKHIFKTKKEAEIYMSKIYEPFRKGLKVIGIKYTLELK